MLPPSFANVGQNCRDVLSKGYNYGKYKVQISSKTENGVQLDLSHTTNHDTSDIVGDALMKYNVSEYNLKVTSKLTTDKFIECGLEWTPKYIEGLNMCLKPAVNPETGKATQSLKANYKREYIHLETHLQKVLEGYKSTASLTCGYKGLIGGYRLRYDSQTMGSGLVALHKVIGGYKGNVFELYSSYEDPNKLSFTAMFNHNSKLTTGFNLSRKIMDDGRQIEFGLGGKYKTLDGSVVGAKIDNKGKCAFSYQIPVAKDLKMTLSTKIDGLNFSNGGHQVGFGFKYCSS